jgi:toxin FitB
MPKTKKAASPVVLDSSCWIEYFGNSERATLFAKIIEKPEELIVPMIVLYEVYKKVCRLVSDEAGHAVVSLMYQCQLIEADVSITLSAANNGLPLADSLIYATAQRHHATLWTQDAHFEGLPGVNYFPKGVDE